MSAKSKVIFMDPHVGEVHRTLQKIKMYQVPYEQYDLRGEEVVDRGSRTVVAMSPDEAMAQVDEYLKKRYIRPSRAVDAMEREMTAEDWILHAEEIGKILDRSKKKLE